MKKTAFSVRRLVLDAVLVALYVVLGFVKIPIGNMLRINFAAFAVVICAVAFSPIDGFAVGFLGEFLSQVLGPYGLTPTTLLWSLPLGVQGLLLGFAMVLLARKGITISTMKQSKSFLWYMLACIVAGLVASLLNTLALYVDSKMFGYYNYYMVFGVLLVRLGLSVVLSVLFGSVTLPVVSALQRNKII